MTAAGSLEAYTVRHIGHLVHQNLLDQTVSGHVEVPAIVAWPEESLGGAAAQTVLESSVGEGEACLTGAVYVDRIVA